VTARREYPGSSPSKAVESRCVEQFIGAVFVFGMIAAGLGLLWMGAWRLYSLDSLRILRVWQPTRPVAA
jgi:hypothetical protein